MLQTTKDPKVFATIIELTFAMAKQNGISRSVVHDAMLAQTRENGPFGRYAKTEEINELHLIDTNCNDCKFMTRNNDKNQARKQERKSTGVGDRYQYGNCSKFDKEVFFSPNTCMPENQECFKHRKSC